MVNSGIAQMAQQFFIIGAPKCGTTSLARWLEQHPQVLVMLIREPHCRSKDLANQNGVSRHRYNKAVRECN